ncbi:O-antigen ligase family protein [Bowmanella sp. Y26]|uniref:O-antigen ligase family protein n=1 Tax=Bowmanella yangjiangensis TaxID=2811230 RepID=UPI001BDC235F|nr:O-antigen ligase family protein [Bowmanella yangjiangensis]MBT1064582.1 O-antigen ligase family protein [Bowmanella yangjiangensis]
MMLRDVGEAVTRVVLSDSYSISLSSGWIKYLFLILSVVLFLGAFTDHFVFGVGYGADLSNTPKIINSLLKFPLYFISLYMIFRNYKFFSEFVYEMKYYLAFVFLCMISTYWTADKFDAIVTIFSLAMCLLVAFGLAQYYTLEQINTGLYWTFLFLCLSSIFYVFFIPSLGLMSAGEGFEYTGLVGENQGVFKHKNIFGGFAAISLAFSVVFYEGSKLSRAIIFTSSLVCLFLASSSTKIFALAFAFVFYYGFIFSAKVMKSKRNGVALFFTSSSVLIVIFLVSNLIVYLIELAGKDLTFTGRTVIWEHALLLIKEKYLIGYGVSSIWSTDLGYIPEIHFFIPSHSHNSFIEILLMVGILGLSLMMLFILKGFWDGFVRFFSFGRMSSFFVVVFVFALLDSCFEYTFFRGNNFLFMFVLFLYSSVIIQNLRLSNPGRV